MVDDHPIVRDGLIGILSRETDMTVVGEAASGSEGVVVIERTRPDVALMDLRMPNGDGVSAIRTLREHGVTVPVLVLTTYDTDRDSASASTRQESPAAVDRKSVV